ncbi:extracellular solute-binding protein [Petroclostridium xylanilyticum]|jgi:putative aldouronate transport system substrate-binding protein|uniref:extracellular solute-binding protein n=1 Tax=Petroclostridium xylanilyticum TaxID=1792311 RepID=UPI000B99CCE4|nr:extracellular solute-binding protein [Petroclostridium xylanilyticum]
MGKPLVKRTLSIFIAIVLALSVAACTKKAEQPAAPEKSEKSEASKEPEKPASIKLMVDGTFITKEAGQDQFVAEYKKMTGVDLIINQPAHNQYYEKVNLAFASQDIPDVLIISGTTMVNYAINGALYDMTDLVDKSPIMQKVGQKYKDAVKINGRLYAFPTQAGNGPITYMRKDWLEKNNLKVPTTYAEYLEVLKVFANDPDQNGKQDTIAFTAPGLVSDDPTTLQNYMVDFYQDASPDFIKKDGKWVDGMLEPEMKAALERMREAYSLGLIDKEIVTNKTSTCRDKFNAGKVGVFTYWAGTWNMNLENELKKAVRDASIVAIPAIKETKYLERVPATMAITSKAANPEGIFKYFFEFMHDGDKGTLLFSHGVEGVHYKVTDGKYEKLPSLQDPKKPANKAFIDNGLQIVPFNDPITPDPRITESLKVFNANSIVSTLLPVSENYTKNSADILTARKETISKIVLGQMTIEEGLAKYEKDTKAITDLILKDFNAAK